MVEFKHIHSDPEILGGKPVVRGTRVSISLIMEWLASGASPSQIANKHPMLNEEIVLEAIQYAARFIQNEVVIEVKKTNVAF